MNKKTGSFISIDNVNSEFGVKDKILLNYKLAQEKKKQIINKSISEKIDTLQQKLHNNKSIHKSIASFETQQSIKNNNIRLRNIKVLKNNVLKHSNNSEEVKQLLEEYQNKPNL